MTWDVPASDNAFFSGWNRGNEIPTSTRGIHHAYGDEKRISTDIDAPIIVDYFQPFGSSYWRVVWDSGTTQSGSSGSGLWDQNGRLVGLLSGGSADCRGGDDRYGRFSKSWNGIFDATRLSNWLDPINSGVTAKDSYR